MRALARRYDSDPTSPIARQGGSSITQQLVKNLLLSPEKTLKRKVAEAYMSVILETRLSKEQIFELYCNQVYLGQQSGFSINGFGEAADAYFNKDVTTLTLPESAFLAGIIRSPNRYNPYHDLDTATARRNQVLDNLAETGEISGEEAALAKQAPLQVAATKGRIDASDAPYFADYVQGQLGDIVPGRRRGSSSHLHYCRSRSATRSVCAVSKQLAALDKVESNASRLERYSSADCYEREDRRNCGDGWRPRLRQEPTQSCVRRIASTRFSFQAFRLCNCAQYGIRSSSSSYHTSDDLSR